MGKVEGGRSATLNVALLALTWLDLKTSALLTARIAGFGQKVRVSTTTADISTEEIAS